MRLPGLPCIALLSLYPPAELHRPSVAFIFADGGGYGGYGGYGGGYGGNRMLGRAYY